MLEIVQTIGDSIGIMNKLIGDNESVKSESHPTSKMGQDDYDHNFDEEDHRYEPLEYQKEKKKGHGDFFHENQSNSSSTPSFDNMILGNNRWSMSNTMYASSVSNHHNGGLSRGQPRRTSTLSDITFDSEDHAFPDDTDAHTTDSNDSSWANGYAALLTTARHFAPHSNLGTTIEENRQSTRSSAGNRSSSATTDAPVIPQRRVSVKCIRPPAANSKTLERLQSPQQSKNYCRSPTKGNAAPPSIPKRSVSNKFLSNNYTAKTDDVTTTIFSQSSEAIVSIHEDGGPDSPRSISTSGTNSDQQDATATTPSPASHTQASTLSEIPIGGTEKGEIYHDQRKPKLFRLSREDIAGLVPSADPPILPERRASGYIPPRCFVLPYGSGETLDEEDLTIDQVCDMGKNDQSISPAITIDSAGDDDSDNIPNNLAPYALAPNNDPITIPVTMTQVSNNQAPTIPLRQPSDSQCAPSILPSKVSPHQDLNQAPTCPVRKESRNFTTTSSHSLSIVSSGSADIQFNADLQSSILPPIKPMRQPSENVLTKNQAIIAFLSTSNTNMAYPKHEVSNQPPAIPIRQASHSIKISEKRDDPTSVSSAS